MKAWSPHRLFAGIFVVVLLAAVTVYQPSHIRLWLQSFFNWLHVPLFGLIAAGLLFATPADWHWRRKLLVAGVATVVLAIATELVQLLMPARSASFGDFANDLLGAAAFAGLIAATGAIFPTPRWLRVPMFAASAALIAWSAMPLADVTAAYWERHTEAPSIAPLKSRKSRLFYYLDNATVHFLNLPEAGRVLPQFQFSSERASSIKFHDPLPDWRGFDRLVIDIANAESDRLCLVLRIHDRAHLDGDQPVTDRFRREFCIAEGRRQISIGLADIASAPAGRQMNLGRIDGVTLYRTKPGPARRFVLHDIRLE